MDKKPLNFRIDAALLDRLDIWISEQDIAPTKTAVVEKALNEFLERR